MVRWEPEAFFLSYSVLDWMLSGYPHCLESGALVPNLQCLCRCLLVDVSWTCSRAHGSLCLPHCHRLFLVFLQGIQFLIENDLLKNTCEDIAQFLYKGEGLNKTAIGDYLGER